VILTKGLNMKLTPFHLAVQVRDIAEARAFYGEKMGFAEGRSSEQWIDFDMFGHQFVVHLNPDLGVNGKVSTICNGVDGHGVPVPHFGVVLTFEQWQEFAVRAQDFVEEFIIEPYVRFAGEVGEQGTMFFSDPSGNALEFKGFRDIEKELFANECSY
jgi:extradiol dioxygenase family protein